MSQSQQLNQICNIAGYPMYQWAIDQLRQRSKVLSNPNRNEDQINYLGNKGAWIRVVSSVDLEEQFIKYFKDQYGDFTGFTDTSNKPENLAKNFVLFGGTSIYQSKTNNLLRSGINAGGSYAILGDTEVNEYGYKPMPGITSVTIESMGRMGSVRQATVNFRVSDKMQLDIMDALYFRPGFTLLIEYGHAKYIDNNGALKSTEEYMIDPFDENYSKESIGIQISRNIQKSAGNYGGMLSVITSFNFSITQDGGYDCVLKTIAMGGVMGNYPINNLSILPNIYIENAQKYIDEQKQIDIATARAAAQKAKDDALSKIPQRRGDNWNTLGITDPLSNLIYNLDNSYLDKASFIGTNNRRQYILNAAVNPNVPSNVEDAVKDYSSIYFLPNTIENTVVIPTSIADEEIAIFIKDQQKYIAAYYKDNQANTTAQRGEIFVKINLEPAIEAADKFRNANTGFIDIAGSIIERVLTAGLPELPEIQLPEVRLPGLRQFDIVYPISEGSAVKYLIRVTLPRGSRGKLRLLFNQLVNNKDKLWKVKSVKISNISNSVPPPVYANIVLETTIDGEVVTISLGPRDNLGGLVERGTNENNTDLSIITEIIEKDPNQDLAKNKIAEQIAEIETQFQEAEAAAVAAAEANALDANAKTLKAIANSQSSLELMLRSFMLYAIDEDGVHNPDSTFIRRLFSEGAYSSIFNKGIPQYKSYSLDEFTSYIDGSMPAAKRLEINLRYGNSARLMSAENISDGVNLLKEIDQVDFQSMFKIVTIPYGQTADTGIVNISTPVKKSVYISLGCFFLMLNHTGILYNSKKDNDTLVPVTYVDFNPSTNFYLSSVNQFSVDPFKFIMPYLSGEDNYKKLFKKEVLQSDDTIRLELSGSVVQDYPIFNFSSTDKISSLLPNNKKGLQKNEDGYIGRTMDVMVNINYLLDTIKKYKTGDDFGEAFFQSILEDIIASFNKSTGFYNAFRLSYSDSGNAFMIVDDHLQLKPDGEVQTAVSNILKGINAPEIPIQGKGSIARSFDFRTDMSSRLASMIAISSNPGTGNQVGMAKNTSDFGVYNIGSHDRYMKIKTSDPSTNVNALKDNVQECQAAISFDTVVSSIYGLTNDVATNSIDPNDIQHAILYYKEKMARIKNEQAGSVAAMIIPIKSSITMDGFSGIYPFQLFTINENMLPYRYSQKNLNNSKVAFSIARITHNFSNNEWITSMDGNMTFLNSSDDQPTKKITPTSTITGNFTTAAAGNEVPTTGNYPNIIFADRVVGRSTPSTDNIYKPLLQDVQKAAAALGNNFKVSITTAVSGHGKGTRHASGNAVDIAIINGKSVNSVTNRGDADKFVAELKKLGYSLNVSEIGGPEKTIFWIFPGHNTHVHVGYKPTF
jgi:hypothetical protein